MTVYHRIKEIEKRFQEVSGIKVDISEYPLKKANGLQVDTRSDKSKSHGEVFTPLWLVDKMIDSVDDSKYNRIMNSLDLCSGYGQYSIRLIRKYYKVQGENFDLDIFFEKHWFSELQGSSCYKLLYIFGTGINLASGDSTFLSDLFTNDKARGTYFRSPTTKEWYNRTKRTKKWSEEKIKRKFS